MDAFSMSRTDILSSDDVRITFNYAMAEWGATKRAPIDLLKRRIELSTNSMERGCNFYECLALASAVTGNPTQARMHLQRAKDALDSSSEFSCWRYLKVSKPDMLEDLAAIEQSLISQRIPPAFLKLDSEALK
jgi:hypothetical protein